MSHDPHRPTDADDGISGLLAGAQIVLTIVLLGAIGALAYTAGMHAARGGHGGEGEGTSAAPAAAAGNVDVATLLKPTPELVAQGKSLFAVNCTSCHGTTGHGDGPASVALNPKPRNFTSAEGWHYGSGVARITRTLSEGSPGTAMAAFQMIALPDRIALAHYVRSLNPSPMEDKQADLDWLGVGKGGATTGGAAAPALAAGQPGPTIPIEKAMALLTEPAPAVGAVTAPAAEDTSEGARLFAARCAGCHGAAGQGGVRTRMLGSAPYAYVVTRSLGDPRGMVGTTPESFDRIVTEGIPGAVMPGAGDLSRSSLRELYDYTQTLRARQMAAGRGSSS